MGYGIIKGIEDATLGTVRKIVPGVPCIGNGDFVLMAVGSGFIVRSVPRLQTVGAEVVSYVPLVGPMVAGYLTPEVHMALAGALKPLMESGGRLTGEALCGALWGFVGGKGPDLIPRMTARA